VPPPESARTRTVQRRCRGSWPIEPGRLDVVGRGVGAGVAGPQHEGQRLPVPGLAVISPGHLKGAFGW